MTTDLQTTDFETTDFNTTDIEATDVPATDAPTMDAPTGFATFGLRPELVQIVAELGYTEPTPIQASLIPAMLAGGDVVGQAQTGTGKTAAFALPVLHALTPGASHVQALVLVPTRELAMQVASAIYSYGRPIGARVLAVYGGQPYQRQIDRLRRGVDVVVATPGRLMDLLDQNALDLGQVSTVVLDEADEMLSMGFVEDIQKILDGTPEGRQTALLSATMPPAIRRLATRYLRDPQTCTVAAVRGAAEAIEQRYYAVRQGDKVAALARLLEVEPVVSAVVFVHTRAGVAEVAEALAERGFAAEGLSGEMSQVSRADTLERFRRQRLKVLVATDVAARGLDIDHVSHVFNMDLPRDPEVYVHRIGRTGRAGKTGIAIAMVAPHQRRLLQAVEGFVGRPIDRTDLPTAEAVEAHRGKHIQAAVEAHLALAPAPRDRDLLMALLAEGHDPMDVAAAALAAARADERPIEHIEPVYDRPARPSYGASNYGAPSHGGPRHSAPAGRPTDRPAGGYAERPGAAAHGRRDVKMVPITMDTGRAHGTSPAQVVGALAYWADIPGNAIGKIRIEEDHTRVDVPEHLVGQVLARRGAYMIERRRIAVERA